jgi:hypothetical protein
MSKVQQVLTAFPAVRRPQRRCTRTGHMNQVEHMNQVQHCIRLHTLTYVLPCWLSVLSKVFRAAVRVC